MHCLILYVGIRYQFTQTCGLHFTLAHFVKAISQDQWLKHAPSLYQHISHGLLASASFLLFGESKFGVITRRCLGKDYRTILFKVLYIYECKAFLHVICYMCVYLCIALLITLKHTNF